MMSKPETVIKEARAEIEGLESGVPAVPEPGQLARLEVLLEAAWVDLAEQGREPGLREEALDLALRLERWA